MFSISTMASSTRMPITSDKRQQRDDVDRKAHPVHHGKGRNGRQRQCHGRHQRGAPLAQEEPDHHHGQQRAFQQQRHRAVVVLDHRLDEVESLGDDHVGVGRAHGLQRFTHTVGHFDLAGAARTGHFEGHHGLAIQPCRLADLGHGVAHLGQFVQAHAPAIGQGDLHRTQLLRRSHGGDRAHRLLGAAEIGAAARGFLLHLAQLARDVGRRGVQRQQALRVQLHHHLARHAAHARDATHAAHGQQRLADLVVDEPGQGLVVHARGGHGVGQHRHRRKVHLGDDRVAQFGGQVRSHTRHGVAHVVHRFLRRLFEPELGRHGDRAVARRGVDVLEPLHAGDGVLDLARDLGFHLGRRGTGQDRRDDDHRQVDVHELLDLHRPEAHHAQHGEHDEQQHGRHRVADGGGGNVDLHRLKLSVQVGVSAGSA
jgi:hypothetical protein